MPTPFKTLLSRWYELAKVKEQSEEIHAERHTILNSFAFVATSTGIDGTAFHTMARFLNDAKSGVLYSEFDPTVYHTHLPPPFERYLVKGVHLEDAFQVAMNLLLAKYEGLADAFPTPELHSPPVPAR